MKYTIYEDPITHRFAHAPLPSHFVDGDRPPAVVTDRWFESHDAAVAALQELLDRDEGAPDTVAEAPAPPLETPPPTTATPPRRVVWFQH